MAEEEDEIAPMAEDEDDDAEEEEEDTAPSAPTVQPIISLEVVKPGNPTRDALEEFLRRTGGG